MSMLPTDRILSAPRADASTVIAYATAHGAKRLNDVRAYVTEVYRLAPQVKIDPAIVVAQSSHETNVWTSDWWVNRLNPAGIGITGDPKQNAASGAWKNGTDAARAHIVHLAAYVGVEAPHNPNGPLYPYLSLDPRYEVLQWSGWYGQVRTINDLTGKWGVDPQYAAGVCARGNQLFPHLPNQGTEQPTMATIPSTQSVPTPRIYNLATDYAHFGISQGQAQEVINSRFENRSGGDPRFIVCHIQDGNTPGSLQYWSSPDIDASSTVMIQRDGSILRVIPEGHGPWTNGDVNRPTAQANELLALGGNPNNWCLTIEAEGDASNDLTDVQTSAVIWQIETWLMSYPKILQSAWCMLEHAYINSVDRAFCGLYLYGEKVVDAINDWLASAQAPAIPTAPAKPAPPKSPYPKGMSAQLAKRLYGSLDVSWSSKPFTFDLKRSECRWWLAHGSARIPEGGGYQEGDFPKLVDVIRRGDGKTRTFQWSDGTVYEQVVRGQ